MSVQLHIPETVIDGKRLGRHILHDPKSREHQAKRATQIVSITHKTAGLPLNQGAVGSCTAEALVGVGNTAPNRKPGIRLRKQKDAYALYSVETEMEGQPWPPNDPGGSGLEVCKAAKHMGWITAYQHAFGIQHALEALVVRPVITGISWYEGFDEPDPTTGEVKIAGQVRGGHEIEAFGIDVDAKMVLFEQSWGRMYGLKGVFRMAFSTWDRLLAEQGDVTVPIF